MPRGATVPSPADSSASSRSASSWTQRSWNARPISVSDKRRVVRLSSRASRCASSSVTWRDTDDTDTAEPLGGTREAAGLDDFDEGFDGVEAVHGRVPR